jgi:hypothetical protein
MQGTTFDIRNTETKLWQRAIFMGWANPICKKIQTVERSQFNFALQSNL